MDRFPEEILLEIARYLDWDAADADDNDNPGWTDVKSFALVCKRFSDTVRPLLYNIALLEFPSTGNSSFYFRKGEEVDPFAKRITKYDAYKINAEHIRYLHYDIMNSIDMDPYGENFTKLAEPFQYLRRFSLRDNAAQWLPAQWKPFLHIIAWTVTSIRTLRDLTLDFACFDTLDLKDADFEEVESKILKKGVVSQLRHIKLHFKAGMKQPGWRKANPLQRILEILSALTDGELQIQLENGNDGIWMPDTLPLAAAEEPLDNEAEIKPISKFSPTVKILDLTAEQLDFIPKLWFTRATMVKITELKFTFDFNRFDDDVERLAKGLLNFPLLETLTLEDLYSSYQANQANRTRFWETYAKVLGRDIPKLRSLRVVAGNADMSDLEYAIHRPISDDVEVKPTTDVIRRNRFDEEAKAWVYEHVKLTGERFSTLGEMVKDLDDEDSDDMSDSDEEDGEGDATVTTSGDTVTVPTTAAAEVTTTTAQPAGVVTDIPPTSTEAATSSSGTATSDLAADTEQITAAFLANVPPLPNDDEGELRGSSADAPALASEQAGAPVDGGAGACSNVANSS